MVKNMYKTLLTITVFLYASQSLGRSDATMKACTVHGAIYKVISMNQECVYEYLDNEISFQLGDPLPDLDGNAFVMPPTNAHGRLEPHNPECFDSHPM